MKMHLCLLVELIAISATRPTIHLTRSGDSSAYCPGERVMFECTITASLLEWSIYPPSQLTISRTFLHSSSLNLAYELSWPGLSSTVVLTYTSRNSTSMTSTAEVTASSEFHEARFSCSGLVEASKRLLIADRLTFINNLSFRISENSSQQSVQLNWNEPFMDSTYSGNVVDNYFLDINGITMNTTKPTVIVALMNDSVFDVGVSAGNCYGITPKTMFHLTLNQEQWPTPSTAIAEQWPPTSCSGRSIFNHLGFMVAVMVGTSATSASITGVCCLIIIILTYRKAKKKHKKAAPLQPVYDELRTKIKGNFTVHANEAYTLRQDFALNCH